MSRGRVRRNMMGRCEMVLIGKQARINVLLMMLLNMNMIFFS